MTMVGSLDSILMVQSCLVPIDFIFKKTKRFRSNYENLHGDISDSVSNMEIPPTNILGDIVNNKYFISLPKLIKKGLIFPMSFIHGKIVNHCHKFPLLVMKL